MISPIKQNHISIGKQSVENNSKINMAEEFCNYYLKKDEQLVQHHRTVLITFTVFDLIFSLVATVGNILAVCGLWKASSIPATIKTLFLSLAFSDLAVGSLVQSIRGIIIAVMLRMAANGNYNFDIFCPTTLTLWIFSAFLLVCASCLNITAIAVDRLLALSLHLRYQELVTSKRVITTLVFLWLSSGVASSIFILLPSNNNVVVAIISFAGLLLTSVAYVRIQRIVRYHQRQIQSQHQQQNTQTLEKLRENKAALNALVVYVVFLVCCLPYVCCLLLLIINSSRVSFWAAYYASFFFVFLNSSINPLIYCWRYREIREIVKSKVKKAFNITET